MSKNTLWAPLGIPAETWENVPEQDSIKAINLSLRSPRGDRPPGSALIACAAWLLALIGAGALYVSYSAQYKYVFAARHQDLASITEALLLDLLMIVFTLLALGLSRAGKSSRTERALILASAAASAYMNVSAADTASPRSVVAYAVAPVALAVVVDRVVAVIRRHVLADDEPSAWTALGRAVTAVIRLAATVVLYMLRLLLAPRETATGLRRQVLVMTPLPTAEIAPAVGRCPECLSSVTFDDGSCASCGLPGAIEPSRADLVHASHDTGEPGQPGRHRQGRSDSKTSRFLALVEDRHGPLAAIDLAKVSRIASDLAPEIGLHPGSARSALRAKAVAAQNGHSS